MPLFIDAHQDLAFNMMTFQRDYRRPVMETRKIEEQTNIPAENGHTLLGWPEYQQSQTAIIFGTLFILPANKANPNFPPAGYSTPTEAKKLYQTEIDLYRSLTEENTDMFQLISNRQDLSAVMKPWQSGPAQYPQQTHPVGLVLLMEGAEGISDPDEMAYWWEQGVRIVGPVWDGGRFCGSSTQPGSFTNEGISLLRVMSELGLALDISHMSTQSALYAMDYYDGPILASHANVLKLIPGFPSDRPFKEETIRGLIARDGVMGAMPVNFFLKSGWKSTHERSLVNLDMFINHIDFICQLAGNTKHTAIGTDFDGGFGFPDVPDEINSISDIQLIADGLAGRGYQASDIEAIFYGNWLRMLERILPSHG